MLLCFSPSQHVREFRIDKLSSSFLDLRWRTLLDFDPYDPRFFFSYLQVTLVLVAVGQEEAFTLQAGIPREAVSIPVAAITPT